MPGGVARPERRHTREAVLVFVVAVIVRLAAMVYLGSPDDARGKSAWPWGYEAACIAQSLADDEGFASPWKRDEIPWNRAGVPTAWLPPAYPAFLSVLMRCFGGVTPATAAALFVVQSVLAAATCVLLSSLGSALGEPRAGRLAAWLFCFHPASIWHASHTVWDTTLVAFALVAFLVLLARFGSRAGAKSALCLGASFGALLLVNPSPASIGPVILIVFFLTRRSTAEFVQRSACFAVAALAVCVPWSVRNAIVLGSPSLRPNLGVEFAVGNNDEANGYFQPSFHPSYNAVEYRKYVELGEVRYSKGAMRQAWDWIRTHPARFAALSLKRALIYWFGEIPWSDPRREGALSARDDPKSWIKWIQHLLSGTLALAGAVWMTQRRRFGSLVLLSLVLYPVPYYVTHFMERYRFPVEPLCVFCAAWLISDAWTTWRTGRFERSSRA